MKDRVALVTGASRGIGKAIAFAGNAYMTGQTIAVNGGTLFYQGHMA